MKISVIIPVYNVEKYLSDCIDSVLQQTYKNFEVILVDDGSTDGSGSICDEFAQRNPQKIVVTHRKNQGPLLSRICGIEYARGDVIVFLDSDDCLNIDALVQLAECFQRENCDMVLFDAGICPDYSSRQITHALSGTCVFERNTKKDLYKKLIMHQIPGSVCLKAIKRDCTILPVYFSDFADVKHGEDLLMSAYFLTNCRKVVYLNKGLYYYRNRPESAIHSFDIKRKDSVKTVHTELEKCIDLWEMPELKPLHNARKVKGWADNLLLLLRNRDRMDLEDYKVQIASMAEDPYFIYAYQNMESNCLAFYYRIIAFCLWKKWYVILTLLGVGEKPLLQLKQAFRRR